MMAKRMRRGQITLSAGVQVHDRRATDLLRNAMVVPFEVQDPYAVDGIGRIVVMRSLRDDPLAGMFARRQIDQAQYDAGRKWQAYMEDAEVGNIRAIDPTKEAVDGGRMPEPLSDRAAFAFRELSHAHATLGMIGENIVRDILGANRMSIKQAAAKRYCTKAAEIEFWGKRFREALETLAVVFGCATGGRR